jgi:hypothetical protein
VGNDHAALPREREGACKYQRKYKRGGLNGGAALHIRRALNAYAAGVFQNDAGHKARDASSPEQAKQQAGSKPEQEGWELKVWFPRL